MSKREERAVFPRKFGLRWPKPMKPEPRSYGKHAPVACREVARTFVCPECLATHYFPKEDMRETDGLSCFGDGIRVSSEG